VSLSALIIAVSGFKGETRKSRKPGRRFAKRNVNRKKQIASTIIRRKRGRMARLRVLKRGKRRRMA
jgi:hypothetical protein